MISRGAALDALISFAPAVGFLQGISFLSTAASQERTIFAPNLIIAGIPGVAAVAGSRTAAATRVWCTSSWSNSVIGEKCANIIVICHYISFKAYL